jgi:hypothetical protein
MDLIDKISWQVIIREFYVQFAKLCLHKKAHFDSYVGPNGNEVVRFLIALRLQLALGECGWLWLRVCS